MSINSQQETNGDGNYLAPGSVTQRKRWLAKWGGVDPTCRMLPKLGHNCDGNFRALRVCGMSHAGTLTVMPRRLIIHPTLGIDP